MKRTNCRLLYSYNVSQADYQLKLDVIVIVMQFISLEMFLTNNLKVMLLTKAEKINH